MNKVRIQINQAIDAIIEAEESKVFQRMAIQCLCERWPSFTSIDEHTDLGEDGITIISETSDGIIRSLACSIEATLAKVRNDAIRISENRSDVQELIFATPKSVTRKRQKNWENEIRQNFGWRLVVVDRSEFLAILERPDSQWICKKYLDLTLGYFHLLKGAEEAISLNDIETSLKKAEDAERGALDQGDWETVCRAQILQAKLHSDKEGLCDRYRKKALEALLTARENNLRELLAECLALRANSIIAVNQQEAQKLLDESSTVVTPTNIRIQRWICLIRAELELNQNRLDEAKASLSKWESMVKRGDSVDRQGYYHLSFRLNIKEGNHSEGLLNLAKSIKRARLKKRWLHVGMLLREKAVFLAKEGNLKRAALEADKAREAFGKAGLLKAKLDAALLSGHLFLESKSAEMALGLSNYVIQRADVNELNNILQSAYQLKIRSLQGLDRIDEAREWNNRFREFVAFKPQALLVADAQDAMLYAQIGELEKADELMNKALKRAKETKVKKEIVAAIEVHLADIQIRKGKYREARTLAEKASAFSSNLPDQVNANIKRIIEYSKTIAPITSEYESLLQHREPLQISETDECKDILTAHQHILQTCLDWTEKWPDATSEIYDFWGRGNFARFILNHRGFQNAFHVTVEAKAIEEMRQWTLMLCPLVDVLTILWKGPVESGMSMVPVHVDYEGPGGWGYAIAAGNQMRPDKQSDDWNWAPAMGWATLLPRRVTKFLFTDARSLFKAGRLFVLPALNVGCLDNFHGPLERIFSKIANAVSYLSGHGGNCGSKKIFSLPLPYFPDIPLSELANVIDGEEDSLLGTRLALREWARNIVDREIFETKDIIRECREKVEYELKKISRKYEDIKRKLSWAQNSGEIRSFLFEEGKLDIEPKNPAAAELVALHEDLRSSPWYAYFRLGASGFNWDLIRKSPKADRRRIKEPYPPKRVYHWLVPPKAGWTIPTLFVGENVK
jgi:hypothetical protein